MPEPSSKAGEPSFYSVKDAAKLLGVSAMTIYRAIEDCQFPAVKIRGRYVIPSKAIHSLESMAIAENRAIDSNTDSES